MDDHGVEIEALDGGLLDLFAAGFVPGTPGRSMAIGRISVVRRFLLEPRSQSRHAAGPEPAGPAGAELDAWGAWQRDQAAVSEGVLRNRRGWAGGFVAALADGDAVRWEDSGVAMVNAYIVERGKGYAPASCSLLVSAMRSLLRWALATGRIDRDLSRGILRPRATRATLPRGLTPGQVDALLAAASPATRVGVRDRAVVITLSRLGLRAGEAAGLTLDDIDWAAGRLTVIGKGQRRLALSRWPPPAAAAGCPASPCRTGHGTRPGRPAQGPPGSRRSRTRPASRSPGEQPPPVDHLEQRRVAERGQPPLAPR